MKPLFIHIPKNAGSAVKTSPYSDRFDRVGESNLPSTYLKQMTKVMEEAGEATAPAHARFRDVSKKHRAGRKHFAIIRNPWSRVVSRWTFYQHVVSRPEANAPSSYTAKTFDEFLEERHIYGDLPFYWHRAARGWFNQTDYVMSDSSVLKVDCLRFESLDKYMQAYFSSSVKVPYRNVSNGTMRNDRSGIDKRKHYSEYYNDKRIQIVADWYAQDVEFFGFDFDSTATKNII